ncbi:MAG: hypothetical protein ILNGONEN_00313 [Syntrophorhabdaceae bacterium]|nr:hypothetical protein [Syntrophorhabdaceae bacterium]
MDQSSFQETCAKKRIFQGSQRCPEALAKITRRRCRKPRTKLNINHRFFHLALRLRQNWLPTITNSGIHNLSTKEISTKSISALSLGLNFIPVPRLPQSLASHLLTQWQDFRRRINIQYFFSVYPIKNSLAKYRLKSTWEPTEDDFKPYTYSQSVSNYLTQVKNNLLSAASTSSPESFKSAVQSYQNPPWLIQSLRDLRNNHDIIVTEADKNMGIVLIDKDKYISEGLRQLQCPNTYDRHCTVDAVLFRKLYAMLRNILHQFGKLYSPTFNNEKRDKKLSPLAKFLLELETEHQNNFELHAAKFYLLLKMHKNPVAGRPIVSTMNSFTYNVSRYVDGELKCLLSLIPSYIESSQQLIYILETQSFPSSCVICCADIESLYPNIPMTEGIAYVKKSILRLRDRLPYQAPLRNDEHVEFIIALMTWVLKNNYFKFGSQWYLQLQGTAMGTPLAVPFACLFVAHIEHLIWDSQPSVLSPPLFYRRYIDDVFYVAKSIEDAEVFFQKFNNILPTIRCGSITIDQQSGIFLDVEIYKGPRFVSHNILDFRTYQKAQNRYLYLAPNSFHRRDIYKSTIISELNRYRLTCSEDMDFYRMRSLFYQRLVARGYNPEYLNLIFPCHSSRSELLQSIQHRVADTAVRNALDKIPLLFKVTNSSELSHVRLSQLTHIPEKLLEHADHHAMAILSQPVVSCYSNSASSYKYIGNARKTLHQNVTNK